MNLLGIYFSSLPQVQVKCWRSDLIGTRNSCHFSLLAKDLTYPSLYWFPVTHGQGAMGHHSNLTGVP